MGGTLTAEEVGGVELSAGDGALLEGVGVSTAP